VHRYVGAEDLSDTLHSKVFWRIETLVSIVLPGVLSPGFTQMMMNRNIDLRSNRSPQRDRPDIMESKTSKSLPARAIDRQWSACSLCSVDSLEVDELLPIPGRESHTSDLDQFLAYVHRVRCVPRVPGDPPFGLKFWRFVKKILETATRVGYEELRDANAVEPKSARDNDAFVGKIATTSIINPIDPVLIAECVDLPLDEVLTELLYATQVDMLRMRWFPDCEYPGPYSCSSRRPKKKKAAYCSRCRYRNAIAVLKKIKVVFCFNPDIFFALSEAAPQTTEADELLTVVPATFTGSGYRYSIGAGGDMMIRPALEPGLYRIMNPITMTCSTVLNVERTATDEDEPHILRIHVSDILHRPGRQRKTLTVPHGKLHLDIFTDTQSFFFCRIQRLFGEEEDGALTPPTRQTLAPFFSAQDLMEHTTYQYLFENTEVESFHFNSAVKKMYLEASEANDLIAPLKALSCVSDEKSSVVEEGSKGSVLLESM
jgi:hypothetical protein